MPDFQNYLVLNEVFFVITQNKKGRGFVRNDFFYLSRKQLFQLQIIFDNIGADCNKDVLNVVK